MRYTLRLLTAQQFQRATTLVCAAELARREDPATWGDGAVPDRPVGRTDVSAQAVRRGRRGAAKASTTASGHRLTVLQIQHCPWCGTPIDAARRARSTTRPRRVLRLLRRRARPTARSPRAARSTRACRSSPSTRRSTGSPRPSSSRPSTSSRGSRARARPPALFGYVRERCDRHGFVHPDYARCDIKDGSKHPAKGGSPAAAVHPLPAAAAGPDHPGRAAPHHRRARHHGRAVRGRDRRADDVANRERRSRSSR